jgi:Transposase domain (DUF772)
MLCWISIFGGLLIMMGHHARSEALFYYFRLEDQVPENHLLRLIDKHVSFEFVRQQLKESYSETGRPSIDPELLLRILLIGYLYGITSERKAHCRKAIFAREFFNTHSWLRQQCESHAARDGELAGSLHERGSADDISG